MPDSPAHHEKAQDATQDRTRERTSAELLAARRGGVSDRALALAEIGHLDRLTVAGGDVEGRHPDHLLTLAVGELARPQDPAVAVADHDLRARPGRGDLDRGQFRLECARW